MSLTLGGLVTLLGIVSNIVANANESDEQRKYAEEQEKYQKKLEEEQRREKEEQYALSRRNAIARAIDSSIDTGMPNAPGDYIPQPVYKKPSWIGTTQALGTGAQMLGQSDYLSGIKLGSSGYQETKPYNFLDDIA